MQLSDAGGLSFGAEDEVEKGRKGGELSAEERRTPEGMLVDIFNTLEFKEIMKLKGVGEKKRVAGPLNRSRGNSLTTSFGASQS